MEIPTIETIALTTGYKQSKDPIPVSIDLHTRLYPGELTCLLGPNGSGKTTLLKTLSGFLPPLSGKIRILGKNLEEYSPKETARLIGVVLTDKISPANMTAEQLVALGRSPYTGFFGTIDNSDKETINEALRLTGVFSLADRKVATLSDGERQKVMIAKTLAQQTPIIFLDEPTAFLDYPGKADIMLLLRRLAEEENKTIFISTHDLELALQIADKIWLMDKSFGITIGDPVSLSENGAIGKYFDRGGLKFQPSTRTFKTI